MGDDKQVDSRFLTILGVAMAAAVAAVSASGAFDLWDVVIGATLLLILVPYFFEPSPSRLQNLILSMVSALCFALIAGVLISYLVGESNGMTQGQPWTNQQDWWGIAVWATATCTMLIGLSIQRSRTIDRTASSNVHPSQSIEGSRGDAVKSIEE